MATTMAAAPVAIEYEQFVYGNPMAEIMRGLGSDGLGLIIISNVPELAQKRSLALSLIKQFAQLPDEVKAAYVDPLSFYSFGWSHGQEKMRKGVPDIMKGSYYFNPEYDNPNPELVDTQYLLYRPNIWPDSAIPQFSSSVKDLGQIGTNLLRVLLKHCDTYIDSVYPTRPTRKLSDIVNDRINKGRLLHYYPVEQTGVSDPDIPWCGWHYDHSFMTVLFGSIYLDSNFMEVPAPDPDCGLYVKSRDGAVIKITIPEHSIAFQVGESCGILSGGLFLPTAHYVKAPQFTSASEGSGSADGSASDPDSNTASGSFPNITRESMAIFTNASWDTVLDLPPGVSTDVIFRSDLPPGVPTLESRWKPGQLFRDFSNATFSAYL